MRMALWFMCLCLEMIASLSMEGLRSRKLVVGILVALMLVVTGCLFIDYGKKAAEKKGGANGFKG